MIPQLVSLLGAPYRVLPPGYHPTTLPEVHDRFAHNMKREWLFGGIMMVARSLRRAGAGTIFLGGSYVTDKDEPDDFDGFWDPIGVIANDVDPVLRDFSDNQRAQKEKYRGEMFIVSESGPFGASIRKNFQTDWYTEKEKGLLRVSLKGALQ